MADIAAVFHWPPREMNPMDVNELAAWWHRAKARAEPEEEDG